VSISAVKQKRGRDKREMKNSFVGARNEKNVLPQEDFEGKNKNSDLQVKDGEDRA